MTGYAIFIVGGLMLVALIDAWSMGDER